MLTHDRRDRAAHRGHRSGRDVDRGAVLRPAAQAAIVEHFTTVAGAGPVPLVADNGHHRTGTGSGAAAMVELSAHPRIIGPKQAVGALDIDTLDVLAHCAPGFQVLAGDDAFIAPTLLLGGAGAITATAHLCTPQFVELTARAHAGDVAGACELAIALLAIVTIGFSEPNPAVWKGALARDGQIATAELRRPMTPASAATVERLLEAVGRGAQT